MQIRPTLVRLVQPTYVLKQKSDDR